MDYKNLESYLKVELRDEMKLGQDPEQIAIRVIKKYRLALEKAVNNLRVENENNPVLTAVIAGIESALEANASEMNLSENELLVLVARMRGYKMLWNNEINRHVLVAPNVILHGITREVTLADIRMVDNQGKLIPKYAGEDSGQLLMEMAEKVDVSIWRDRETGLYHGRYFYDKSRTSNLFTDEKSSHVACYMFIDYCLNFANRKDK